MENEEKKFIGLEYLEVDSLEKYASIYEDGYSNLGWRLIDQKKQHAAKVTLRFKRDRKIRNKAELTRLQRKFDSLVRDIIHLENSKKTLATASSIFTGIIGCAFLAGSVFFVNDDQIFLCILFSIPGFLC
ncbi:hypothetical protein [Enterococcus hermanniensis]|uniref:hypothetical protein n=1 Tax=Enterococcus hermanniensis TaxID=249189 RepID=UPI001B800292|nr:hypothetical protein [Enterococcus hermanniensis]